MVNAQAQPPEVRAQGGNHVPQPVVPAVPAAPFQAGGAHRQIQLVVRNQQLVQWIAIEVSHRRHATAALIHKSAGLEQSHPVPVDLDVRQLTEKLALLAEHASKAACQLVHEPPARVVAGVRIATAWVTQTHDELDGLAHNGSMMARFR